MKIMMIRIEELAVEGIQGMTLVTLLSRPTYMEAPGKDKGIGSETPKKL